MACALVLARILGPGSYGVISAATIYVTLSTLILDQGLAAALIQRPSLHRGAPGAVATANLVSGVVLAAATWFCAPFVADFFRTPGLEDLLRVLGIGLLVKALAITPRAMQLRSLRFKAIAVADLLGGVLGAAFGITAGLLGAGFWSMAWQVLATDIAVVVVLLAVNRGSAPNLQLGQLRSILPFGLRVFGVNGLAFFSRNADNVLVGRFLGVTSLSYYSMAYRVLVIPVQMIGQTVNRVAFPTFSRQADDKPRVAASLVRTTELLAMVAVPPMVLMAVAARDVVHVVLGDEWLPSAPLLTVLAIAGARETVFYVSGSLMRAMGAARLNLRYEILATVLQLGGIISGLSFGLLGVALGYTAAGFVLVPVLLVLQRSVSGVRIRAQLAAIWPGAHASAWGAAAYLLITLTPWSSALTLAVGGLGYVGIALLVWRVVHRRALGRTIRTAAAITGLDDRRGRAAPDDRRGRTAPDDQRGRDR